VNQQQFYNASYTAWMEALSTKDDENKGMTKQCSTARET